MSSNFAVLDIIFSALLLLFLIRGLLRGFIKEIAGLVGVVLGLFVATRYYPKLIPYFKPFVADASLQVAISYAVILLGVIIAVAIMAIAVQKFMSVTFTAWLDHLLGGVAGLAKGGLICSVALTLLDHFAKDSPFIKKSFLAGYIDQITAFAKALLPVLQ